MLRKLMKYEFMAMGRIFLPLFGALLVISLINGILGSFGLDTPAGIGVAVAVLLIVGIVVITFILIIQRFWTNLLSNEGYLMMTLPVSTDRIILSKLFTATVLSVVSTIVVFCSILLMAAISFDISDIGRGIRYVFGILPFESSQTVILMIQAVIALILSLFTNILLLYACMSLSMLSNRYRWLVAIGAYIAITTALQIIVTVAIAIGVAIGAFGAFERFLLSFPTFGQIQLFALAIYLFSLALCAAYYFTTRYMLKNRLNLQ